MEFCIELSSSLTRGDKKRQCIELEECRPIYAVVDKVIRELKLPVNLENLVILTDIGNPVKPEEDTCRIHEVVVIKAFSGG